MYENKYVVYTEIIENGTCERWYYGVYDHDRANEVALELGHGNGMWHCVCALGEVEAMEILNVPANLLGH